VLQSVEAAHTVPTNNHRGPMDWALFRTLRTIFRDPDACSSPATTNTPSTPSIGWRSLRMALLAMITLSALMAWYARDLAAFMIDDAEVIDLTVGFIYIICLAQPMMAVDFALAGALRGAGDTRFPLLATFIGIIFGRLLPAWLCVQLGLSVYWVFAVMLLDYLLKSCMLMWRYRSRRWLDTSSGRNALVTR